MEDLEQYSTPRSDEERLEYNLNYNSSLSDIGEIERFRYLYSSNSPLNLGAISIKLNFDVEADNLNRLMLIDLDKLEELICSEHHCSICLEQYVNSTNEEAKVSKVQCGHYFHNNCIEKWMSKNNLTCPICRTPMTVIS